MGICVHTVFISLENVLKVKPTYMVDMALTRIGRVENLYIIARMDIVWVTGQPECPFRVDTAVLRVETADACLN